MLEEIGKLLGRKQELVKAIEFTKKKKKEVVGLVQGLVSKFNSGRISRFEYDLQLKKCLKGRNAEQWLKYYDDYIAYYKYQIKLCERLVKEEKKKLRKEKIDYPWILKRLIVFVLIGIFVSLFFILRPVGLDVFKNIGEKISVGIEYLKAPLEVPVEVVEVPEIIPEIPEEEFAGISLDGVDISERATQYQAVIGKPVMWEVDVDEEMVEKVLVLPKDSKVLKIEDEEGRDITSFASVEDKGKFLFLFGKERVEVKFGGAGVTGRAVGTMGQRVGKVIWERVLLSLRKILFQIRKIKLR